MKGAYTLILVKNIKNMIFTPLEVVFDAEHDNTNFKNFWPTVSAPARFREKSRGPGLTRLDSDGTGRNPGYTKTHF